MALSFLTMYHSCKKYCGIEAWIKSVLVKRLSFREMGRWARSQDTSNLEVSSVCKGESTNHYLRVSVPSFCCLSYYCVRCLSSFSFLTFLNSL